MSDGLHRGADAEGAESDRGGHGGAGEQAPVPLGKGEALVLSGGQRSAVHVMNHGSGVLNHDYA